MVHVERGGNITYHGPGQRVAYVMLDLKRRREDVRAFVAALEEWIIRTLDRFNVKGERREDRVGVWVVRDDKPLSDEEFEKLPETIEYVLVNQENETGLSM